MELLVVKDYNELSSKAAEKVADVIKSNSTMVIGLPTGSTPLGMYKNLVIMNKEKKISFCNVTTFNLDEYEGLSKEDPNSYYRFMYDNFFRHIDIEEENINIPDGMTYDAEEECKKYEEKIAKVGGIDFMILGIGNNGHIGFNEPAEFFPAYTYRVKLAPSTIEANSRFFSSVHEVPQYALTMGIKTIMQSRKIMLLASGKAKAKAIKEALEGPITPKVPASVLQLHRDLIVIVDEEAGILLENLKVL